MQNLPLPLLIISLIGIFILLLISQLPQETITGKIIKITGQGEFKVLYLDNNLSLTCDNCNFSQGDFIEAEGAVSEYRGKKQLNADKIKKLE